jgi:uncharacterized protein (DUF2252 family)
MQQQDVHSSAWHAAAPTELQVQVWRVVAGRITRFQANFLTDTLSSSVLPHTHYFDTMPV